jgi:hypothetical protein
VSQKLSVTFTNDSLTIKDTITHRKLLKLPRHGVLWTIPITDSDLERSVHSSLTSTALKSYELPNNAALCLYYQRVLGSPSKSTMVRAALAGNFASFPGLSAKLIQKHYVKTAATAMGHLARTRANLRSTRSPLPAPDSTPSDPPGLKKPNIARAIFHPTDTNYSDGTGNVLDLGFFFLLLYNYDQNSIHAEIVKDHTSASYIAAYNRGLEEMAKDGIYPTHEVMDNVLSKEIADNLATRHIKVHLVPVDDHRTNKAERAIRTFKDHWIANLASVSKSFPLSGIRHLLPQALISLNLLRQSRINPRISAWEQVHGPYDFNAHPMHPPGTRCVVLDDPSKRQSFASQSWHTVFLRRPRTQALPGPYGLQPDHSVHQIH